MSSVCGAGSERVKMSFYDGVKLKGEILVGSDVWRPPSASNAHIITCLLLLSADQVLPQEAAQQQHGAHLSSSVPH